MSQEDRPKFSHITVGQTTDGQPMLPDDEEVISIGAVSDNGSAAAPSNTLDAYAVVGGDDALDADAAAGAGRAAAGAAGPGPRTPSTSKGGTGDAAGGGLPATGADDDHGLGDPMPLAQRIVVAGSAIGLIIVIAFLVWYWAIA